MRGTVRFVAAARARGPSTAQRRNMGFFDNLKKGMQEELEKNKELKDALASFKNKSSTKPKEQETMKNAKESTAKAAEEGAAKGQEFATKAKDMFSNFMGTASEGVKTAKSKASQEVEDKLGSNEFVQNLRQAKEEIKAKVGESEAAKAAKEAASKVKSATSGLDNLAEEMMENKKDLGTKTGYFKAKETEPVEEVPEEEWDKETASLVQVKVKETAWDRKKRKMREMADKHPVLGKLWGFTEKVGDKTGTAAADMGDRVFGETDEAMTVYEIKERDPDFAMMGFIKEVREVIIPEVLEAYLKADEATIKARCVDKAYQSMFASIQERRHQGYVFDDRILAVRNVELAGARVLDNGPTLVITFQAQQIHCIKDKKGVIVDGGPDDIRSFFYTWAFQLDDQSYDLNWQLVEMQTMGAMKMI